VHGHHIGVLDDVELKTTMMGCSPMASCSY